MRCELRRTGESKGPVLQRKGICSVRAGVGGLTPDEIVISTMILRTVRVRAAYPLDV